MATTTYPLNFSASAYGSRPAPTALPKSIYQESQIANPNLAAQGAAADTVIGNQLAGRLSTQTINGLQDNAAQFGVSSGMPGSDLAGSLGLRNLGLNMESLQNQGLTNYLNSFKTIGSMQLDPGMVSGINTYNNQLAAAPDPAAAAQQEYALWQSQRNPAGGTGATSISGAGLGFASDSSSSQFGSAPYSPPAAQAYGYNSEGAWGNMEGQVPWEAPAADPYGTGFNTSIPHYLNEGEIY